MDGEGAAPESSYQTPRNDRDGDHARELEGTRIPPMARRSFDDLVRLMTRLRGPEGCPWDREQQLPDLKPFVIEEAYEVVDAIDREDRQSLLEEVGDLLLEAVFIAEITRE